MTGDFEVAVIGAGQMGSGFAVHFRTYDQPVTVVDHRQSNLEDARDRIRESVAFLREHGTTDMTPKAVLDKITFTLDTEAGVADASLVLETVSEDLSVKRDVFEAVGTAAPGDAILATNTSSLPITDIAEGFDFADRIVGCHWLYPPYLLPTVEVIEGAETDEDTVDELAAILEATDRKPIHVRTDIPGFVWNRVQFAVVRECLNLVEQGVASIEDVNTAVRDGYARRTAVIGPFETMDIAGIDLFHTVASQLYPELDNSTTPHDTFSTYEDAGKTGIEAGEGFFAYDESPGAVTARRDAGLLDVTRALEEGE